MENYGGGRVSRLLPLRSPSREEIREAVQQLSNPERRLAEELFWFWPLNEQEDKALSALSREDLATAVSVWEAAQSDPRQGCAAVHNLAILYHAAALNLEDIACARPISEIQKQQLADWWNKCLCCWSSVIEREDLKAHLDERIREINDPRLTIGFGNRLRRLLPVMILRINAMLAVHAAERGLLAEAQRQVGLIRADWFERDQGTEAIRQSVRPLRRRIGELCRNAKEQAEERPKQADQITAKLLEEASPGLKALEILLPQNDPFTAALSDEVAEIALNCQIQFANSTKCWKRALHLLERIRLQACSDSLQEKIDHNISAVSENVRKLEYWRAEGYEELPDAVREHLEDAHGLAEGESWDAAISLLLELLSGWASATVPAGSEYIVRKPLALCLNCRSKTAFAFSMNMSFTAQKSLRWLSRSFCARSISADRLCRKRS